MRLSIAQTIFITIRDPLANSRSDNILDVTIVFHFEVDADSAVEFGLRVVDVEIGDPSLDDFCEDLVTLLIMSDSNFNCVARVQLFSNRSWETAVHAWRQLVKLVCLATMEIVDLDSVLALRITRMGLSDSFI
jgi:hypothetical protein